MSDNFLAEIRMVPFNFAPLGWALCNGQILSISQNAALFSLIGTTYGGNGQTTFALPNLQGRVPVMFDSNGAFVLGQNAGEESHTLITNELPGHSHSVVASSQTANQLAAPNNFPGSVVADPYSTSSPSTQLGTGMTATGGSQPHENRQPFLVINFCIALTGIFPSRN